jgi:hypothetical protein
VISRLVLVDKPRSFSLAQWHRTSSEGAAWQLFRKPVSFSAPRFFLPLVS